MFNWRNKKRNVGGLKSNVTVVLTSHDRKPPLKELFCMQVIFRCIQSTDKRVIYTKIKKKSDTFITYKYELCNDSFFFTCI